MFYLIYCTIIWGPSYLTHLQPLLRCKKKAMRIITHSPPLTPSKPFFKELKFFSIFQIMNTKSLVSFLDISIICYLYQYLHYLTLILTFMNILTDIDLIYILLLINIRFLSVHKDQRIGILSLLNSTLVNNSKI